MNGLIFDGHTYLKPLYQITARTPEQVPHAFEQMEKLRGSGHLAGYVRKAAFDPNALPADGAGGTGEDAAAGSVNANGLPHVLTPLLQFSLYRLRREVPKDAPSEKVLPRLLPGAEDAPCHVETSCPSALLHATPPAPFAHSAHFFDAFEDVVFWSDREVVPEGEEAGRPVRDLLFDALGSSDMLFASFDRDGVVLCPSDLALEKRSHEASWTLRARPDRRDAFIAALCGAGTPARVRVRCVAGRAPLLGETLEALNERALAQGLAPVFSAEELAALSVTRSPLPGADTVFGEAVSCPWGTVPARVLKALGASETDALPDGVLELALENGRLSAAITPLPEEDAPNGAPADGVPLDVARVCLDERDDRLVLDATAPVLPREALEGLSPAAREILVVNRHAAVACTLTGSVFCRLGNNLFCPEKRDRPRRDPVLDFLIASGLVRERSMSLAQMLAADALYGADPVHGLRVLKPVPFRKAWETEDAAK